MEKINSFKDCKIENLQAVNGGGGTPTAQAGGGTDKNIMTSNGHLKTVTNTHTWFNRDGAATIPLGDWF